MQGRCQCIQIGAWFSIALVLFRWSISGSSQCRHLLTLGTFIDNGTSNAEVDQVGSLIPAADNDIGWLDIAMDNGCLVMSAILVIILEMLQILENIKDLRSIGQRFLLR